MKKLFILSLLLFSCAKENISKLNYNVEMYKNGYKYQYIHNGIPQEANSFTAQSGDSVRLHSAMSLPLNHYAYLVVNSDTVLSHVGFQDTVDLFYILP